MTIGPMAGAQVPRPLNLAPSDPVASGFGDTLTFIPEPGTYLLVALGLCVLAARRSARR